MLRFLPLNWGALAVRGLAAIGFGLVALFMPGLTLAVFTYLFAAYFLIEGVSNVFLAIRGASRHERWFAMLVAGVLGVAAGLIGFVAPLAATITLVVFAAAFIAAEGVLEIVAAVELRKHMKGEWLLLLTGALGVALSVYLIVYPLEGAVALMWAIGFYAVFTGVLRLALAFRLRSLLHRAVPTAGGAPLPAT